MRFAIIFSVCALVFISGIESGKAPSCYKNSDCNEEYPVCHYNRFGKRGSCTECPYSGSCLRPFSTENMNSTSRYISSRAMKSCCDNCEDYDGEDFAGCDSRFNNYVEATTGETNSTQVHAGPVQAING